VINGLAIILSIYIMYPVLLDSYGTIEQHASGAANLAPKVGGPQKALDARQLIDLISTGKEPLRSFLVKHSSDGERAFFLHTARQLLPKDPGQIGADDYVVVVPAFTVTELTTAFQIGFLIFLPFLVIDLIVANILLALGMMMLSPTTVSLPFKLMLFVFLDGWAKLVHGLILTYR
jgi:type III secretion protein R